VQQLSSAGDERNHHAEHLLQQESMIGILQTQSDTVFSGLVREWLSMTELWSSKLSFVDDVEKTIHISNS
jgi:hypothetical protein